MDNTTEDNHTQNGTPEEDCCNPTAEQVPTAEMIEKAFLNLRDLVEKCESPILMHLIIRKDDNCFKHNSTNDAAMQMSGPDVIEWIAARGYMLASNRCFSRNPEDVSQGVKFALEHAHRMQIKSELSGVIGVMEKMSKQ